MISRNKLKLVSIVTCLLTAPVALANESLTADALYSKARELGAAGMQATFRSKQLTVTGIFDSFSDTQVGDLVTVYFSQALDSSWQLSCSFPRSNTAAYDRFALMAPGTPITATGKFLEARDVFYFINLEPCVVH